jgi:hypothetical protein
MTLLDSPFERADDRRKAFCICGVASTPAMAGADALVSYRRSGPVVYCGDPFDAEVCAQCSDAW